MSTSFWCGSCKVDHAGECPPVASSPSPAATPWARDMDPPLGNPGGGFVPARPPGMSPQDFDDLVDEYLQLTDADLTDHYRAAKEALFRKLGAAARSLPVPP